MLTFKEYLSAPVNEQVAPNQSISTLYSIIPILEKIRRQSQTSHWNVRGDDFITMHEAFDKVYEFSGESIDRVAERIKAINTDFGVMVESDYKPVITNDKNSNIDLMVSVLDTSVMTAFLSNLDPVSENMVQEIIIELDKNRWFIESSRNQ